MNETSARHKELVKLKQKLLDDLKNLDESIEVAKEKRRFIEFSSDSSDPEFDVDTFQAPDEAFLRSKCEGLQTKVKATEELSKLIFRDYTVALLSEAPDDLDTDEGIEEFSGSWKHVKASCQIGSVMFDMSFDIHQPDSKKLCTRYHNLSVEVTKPMVSPTLASAINLATRAPSSITSLIRRYSDLLRERKEKLRRKLQDIKYQNIVVTEDATGTYSLQRRNGDSLDWKVGLKVVPCLYFYHDISFSRGENESTSSLDSYPERLTRPDVTAAERLAEITRILNHFLGSTYIDKAPSLAGKRTPDKESDRGEPSPKKGGSSPAKSPGKDRTPKKSPKTKAGGVKGRASPKKKGRPNVAKKVVKAVQRTGTDENVESKLTTTQSSATSSRSRIPVRRPNKK